MSKSLSLTLIVAGLVLVVIAAIEHVFLRVEMLPHLAVYLGILALVALGVGAYGMMRASTPQG